MRKFKLFSLIFTLFVVGFAMSTPVRAQDEMPPDDDRPPAERNGKRPKLLRELNLTPEQVQQIRRINQARRPSMHEAQRRLHEANRALDEAIYSNSPNEADIQAKMKDVQSAQAEIIKIRTTSELAIRKVLTPEQLEKFRELRARFMRRMQNRQNQPPPDDEEPNQQRDVNNSNPRNLMQTPPPPRRRRGF